MNIKKTIPISEARKKIFEIAEEVQKPSTYFTLTEKGKPKAVIMSAEEFDALADTLEILNDPKAIENIKKAEVEYEQGKYITWDELKYELGYAPQGVMLLADKPRKLKLKKHKMK